VWRGFACRCLQGKRARLLGTLGGNRALTLFYFRQTTPDVL
jgi:hypothetical protein